MLTGLHWVTCLVYCDDIIIFSHNVQQHLRNVFVHLKDAGLKVNPAKCHLLQSSVCYLGHVISDRRIETDPEKVKCVADWPVPVNQKATAMFYGSCLILPLFC